VPSGIVCLYVLTTCTVFPSVFCIAGLGPALWLVASLCQDRHTRRAELFKAAKSSCLFIFISRACSGVANDEAAYNRAVLVHVGLGSSR